MEERVSTPLSKNYMIATHTMGLLGEFRPIVFTFGPAAGPIAPLSLPPLFSSSRLREITVLFFPVTVGDFTPALLPRFVATQNRRVTKMSAGGAFGGNRGMRPVPPEKGVFPLDHMHECDLEKKEYVSCLKTSGYQSEICRRFSKKYLECRMEKNLMAKQDMSELGFGKNHEVENYEEKSEKIDGREAASPGVQSKTLAT